VTITLTQGAAETITAKSLTDDDGQPLDPTGWTIHGVICQWSEEGSVVATWRDSPGAGEMLAEVVTADDGSGLKWIVLHSVPAVSEAWTWDRGVMQCTITDPNDATNVARVIDDAVVLDRNCVPED